MINRLNLTPRIRMILRRGLVVAAGMLAAAVLGFAVLIATRDYDAIERQVVEKLEQETGAVLSFGTKRTALWPRPRIVFEAVSFARPDGSLRLNARQVELSFDVRDLIDGTVDGPAIVLTAPEITARTGRLERHLSSPRALTGVLDSISGKFDRPGRFNRLTITAQAAQLRFIEDADSTQEIKPVDFQLRYSARRNLIEFFARREDGATPAEVRAALPARSALGSGKARAASFSIHAYGSRLTFAGTARRDPDLALGGRIEASIGDTFERMMLREAKSARPLSIEPTIATATMTLDPRGIGLDSLVINRASKQLNGIAALREINGRWGVSATLAGDLVDGTAATAALRTLRTPGQAWSKQPLVINPLPGIDLDIRLSTREFKLAELTLANVALSVLTRKGRAEYAIVDSRLGAGTLKARVSVANTLPQRQDVKLQVSGDRLDMASFFGNAFGFNRLAGTGNLVIQAEGGGGNVEEIVGALSGSGALDVRAGEVIGVDLQKLLARSASVQPETALIIALGGRTPFESMRINVALKDGRIEPVGSTFVSAQVTAMLEGAINLSRQAHDLALFLRRRVEVPGLATEFYAFRMDGPLFSPNFKPDLKLLNRS